MLPTATETKARVGSFRVEVTHGSVMVILKLNEAAERVVEPAGPLLAIVMVFARVIV